jgi:ATP-dependent DNA helicase DinG
MLSQWHPNYEFRPGQLVMAEAVESALAAKKHLIVEAGTGTGKTLAYLIPAILSGRRIVISTGTKNLQEQLFYKDIPFLEHHLGFSLRVCYMKGRNNYACRQKIYDAHKMPVLSGPRRGRRFSNYSRMGARTETGDRAEIRTIPENSTVWTKLDARRDMCSGQKCTQFDRCFITKMHQRALESDIIIVNHHLFFADLALKDEEYGSVIPAYSAVVFDEAHDVEEVAGQYFGVSVSNTQLHDLRRDIAIVARQKNFGSPQLDRVLDDAEEICERFFPLVRQRTGPLGVSGSTRRFSRETAKAMTICGARWNSSASS